jgi:hypothetical protein
MSERWRDLRPGDRVRLLRVPEADLQQRERELRDGTYEPGWTAVTLERILQQDPVVTIDRVDEYGAPWFDYELVAADGEIEYHAIAIVEDESWQPVESGRAAPVNAEADSLLQQVHLAFANVPRGPLSIRQAHIAKWADEKRLAQAGEQDHDRRWTEIADATIKEARNALYGADPISWRYFLPAYLSWTIRHFRASDSFLCDQTIYAFSVYKVGEPLRQESVLRFDTLNLPQKRCIRAFLRYMARFPMNCDAKAAQRSLDDYWGQFCAG